MPIYPNSFLLGDCLARMAEIQDGSVDCVLTDLPYGTTSNKWDSAIPLGPLWDAWRRICRPGAPIILFTQQPFTTTVAASNLKQLKTEIVWEKQQGTNFLNARRYPMKVHENILIFCEAMPLYHPQKTMGMKPYTSSRHKGSSNYKSFRDCGERTHNKDGSRLPRSVIRFTTDRGLHPTQKPVALIEYLIRTYTEPGALILDCCAGSGSTAIAAINTDRRYICVERDEAYFTTACDRIANHTPPVPETLCQLAPPAFATSPGAEPL